MRGKVNKDNLFVPLEKTVLTFRRPNQRGRVEILQYLLASDEFQQTVNGRLVTDIWFLEVSTTVLLINVRVANTSD